MRITLVLLMLLGASAAQAQNCTIALKGDDLMKFDQQTVTVSSSCETITLSLEHVGQLPKETMGHNVVISPTASYQAVVQAGMGAGLAGDYVPAGDARVIAHTKVIGGGESTSTAFPASKLTAGEAYTFYCSFPGHWAIMKGELVVE